MLLAEWCPFATGARTLWQAAAAAASVELTILDVEDDAGAAVMQRVGATGVPCLVLGDDVRIYGLALTPEQATAALKGAR